MHEPLALRSFRCREVLCSGQMPNGKTAKIPKPVSPIRPSSTRLQRSTAHGKNNEGFVLCHLKRPADSNRQIAPAATRCLIPQLPGAVASALSKTMDESKTPSIADVRLKQDLCLHSDWNIHARIFASTQLGALHRGKIASFVNCTTAGKAMVRTGR